MTLTYREHQVLQLIAEGHSNKIIGVKLDISDHTVKFHLNNVRKKLGATNRAQAAVAGIRQGLI
jgi:DNA-binding CsgD family transcriptional regulator